MTENNPPEERISSNPDQQEKDIFERALDVLRVPLKERTGEQINLLMKATEDFQFFQDMNAKKRSRESDAHKRICKRLKYETLNPGATVFKLGQFSDKFYIVLKGSVNVLIQKDPEKLRNEIVEYRETYPKLFEKALEASEYQDSKKKVIVDEYSKIDQEKIVHALNKEVNYFGMTGGLEPRQIDDLKHYFKDGVFVYNCVGTIPKGRIFGELGLIMKKSRATTIMVKEKVHFGVLTKADYEEILMSLEAERVYRKILMFKKYLPGQMGSETVTKFSYLFEKVKYNLNQPVYSKGDLSNKVFFVKFGDVLLYKMFNPEEEEAEKNPRKHRDEVKDIAGMLNVNAQSKKVKTIMLPIQKIGVGQFFGEEEIMQGKKTRVYGAICNSAKGTLYVASKNNFLTIVNQRHDLGDFFKKLARLRSAWHNEHQNYLKNATSMTQSIIQNLNKINVKTHRITAGTIDKEFDKLKEHEHREENEIPPPTIRVQALTSEPRHRRAVTSLRGCLPNFSGNYEGASPGSPGQKHRVSLDNSVTDSIANFDRQVQLNQDQIKKAIASSKAVGYQTFMDIKAEKRSFTLAETFLRKKLALQKDPNRHHKSAWKDIDLYQNIKDSAKKSVLEYLSTKLGSLDDPAKIHRLEPKKGMDSSRSQRSLVRSSSSQRPFTNVSARGRSSSTQRPGTSAAVFHSIPGFTKENFNFIGSTPRSPEMSNGEAQNSPGHPQSDFHERRSELEAIEEKDISAKIEAMVFQPQLGCYVNAEFPKLIPKLKIRTKSVADDKHLRTADTARISGNDLQRSARWSESGDFMPSGRSDSASTDFVSTAHRPFYSTGNVHNVYKMKNLQQVIRSIKPSK